MKHFIRAERDEQSLLPSLQELADRAFSRAAGAPLIAGNHVRLLRDGFQAPVIMLAHQTIAGGGRAGVNS